MQRTRPRKAGASPADTSSTRFGRDVLVPFVVSRVLSDTLIAAAAVSAGRRVLRGGFERWDGRWYVAIARQGYWTSWMGLHHHRQTPWPFFPMLPVAMRAVSSVGISVPVAGILVNHVAFLFALAGLNVIARRHGTRRSALIATWLAALSPFAFVFSMIYPSAIFFAASVWAFALVEEGHDLTAGAAAAVAALTRPDGFLLVVVLIFVVRVVPARVVRVAGPAATALVIWLWYNQARTGDALKFLDAKVAWHEVDLLSFVRHPGANPAIHLVIAAVAVALVVAVRPRLPRSWTVYTVVYLAPSLVLGVVGLGRYANDTFPPFVAAGRLLEPRRSSAVIAAFVIFVMVQGALAYWFIAIRAHVI